jgi:hypothetical protein
MTYGSGMPILYLIAAFGFFSTYWVDKAMIMYWHRKPEMLDKYLALNITKWYKWALVLHFLCGALMFANSSILPVRNEKGLTPFEIFM